MSHEFWLVVDAALAAVYSYFGLRRRDGLYVFWSLVFAAWGGWQLAQVMGVK